MFKEELEDLKNRYLTRFAVHTVFSRARGRFTAQHPAASDAAKIATFLRLAARRTRPSYVGRTR